MPCYGPLRGWRSQSLTKAGARAVTFRLREGYRDLEIDLPCGRCIGCKLERSRQWALRCVHEASLWETNVFVTLTYGSRWLPTVCGVPSLRPRDFVLFMKRLRQVKSGVRFLQAGEYGKLGRPHHHVLLFNCDFEDKVFFQERLGNRLYRSAELESLWVSEGRCPESLGFSSIGEVTYESAAYVARYTVKKCGELDRPVALSAREGVVPGARRDVRMVSGDVVVNGEVIERVPEYITMSRKPGIGDGWFKKFSGDVFPSDEVVMRGGRIFQAPRFYDERLKKQAPEMLEKVKRQRARSRNLAEEDGLRLSVKEEIAKRKVNDFLKREV